MITQNYKKIIILEDDAKFILEFTNILNNLMDSINTSKLSWDLLLVSKFWNSIFYQIFLDI